MNEIRKTSAGAVWALVLGILGMCLGPFGAVPAVICGHVSRSKIKGSGGHLSGDRMALAGLILGYVSLFVVAIISSVYLFSKTAIPNHKSFLLFLMILGLIWHVPLIFYLLTLQKALRRCSLEARTLSPGLVWLTLIPVFNLIWHFIVVNGLSKSLGNEFRKRGITVEANPGQTLGLAVCMLSVFYVGMAGLSVILKVISTLATVMSIVALICWITYWVKIAGLSERLAAEKIAPTT